MVFVILDIQNVNSYMFITSVISKIPVIHLQDSHRVRMILHFEQQ